MNIWSGRIDFWFQPRRPEPRTDISEEDLHLRGEHSALGDRCEPWSRGWSDRRRRRVWTSFTRRAFCFWEIVCRQLGLTQVATSLSGRAIPSNECADQRYRQRCSLRCMQHVRTILYIEYMSAVTPGSVSDKRLAIDLTSLRQELWRDEQQEVGGPSVGQRMPEQAKDQLWWICTADMISDQLTKSMRWDAIRQLADNGVFTVTVAHVRAGFIP